MPLKLNFKPFASGILGLFGIETFEKSTEGKSTLTDDQKAILKKYSFSDDFVKDFETALANDFKDEDDSKNADDNKEANAIMKGIVGQLTMQLTAAYSERDTLAKEKGALSDEVKLKNKSIEDLNAKIKVLIDDDEKDPGKGAQHGKGKELDIMNYHDEKQLGGMEGSRFALDRAYNLRAKAHMLYVTEGKSMVTPVASSIDYQQLKDDLGDFYRIPWRDRLQSFLVLLPTMEKIFPCQYGFQDRAVLVNIWAGEFSQSDNTIESDFDKVVKGDYEFDTEELRMFSVMFAHKFRDLKNLEKTWIGNMNKEGSQVIKWSFIEYILMETARKLHNERELRRVNGVRKEPDVNVPGEMLEASDGLYEFLRKKVDGWLDNGRTVYQLKPFVLGEITPGNIGEKIYQGTSQIPAEIRDSGQLKLYMPTLMVSWYEMWQEARFGQNTDYTGVKRHVKEYPSVEIIDIKNADNHNRIIWTLDGNINNYAHVMGEMTNFSIEQVDWTLKVWSNWKESIWAPMVGFKYTAKEDMDGSRQMIWLNEYDYASMYYIKTKKNDATPSVLLHTSIETVANTSLLTITDIKDAEIGKIIRLKCGSDNFGVQITKAGIFSLLTANWVPKKNEVIILIKRADGKFIELGRETVGYGALTFAPDATTPSLEGAIEFVTGINTQATAITNFTDAEERVNYTIYGNGTANASTIANSGNFVLTADITLSAGKFIQLMKSGNKFFEINRG